MLFMSFLRAFFGAKMDLMRKDSEFPASTRTVPKKAKPLKQPGKTSRQRLPTLLSYAPPDNSVWCNKAK